MKTAEHSSEKKEGSTMSRMEILSDYGRYSKWMEELVDELIK